MSSYADEFYQLQRLNLDAEPPVRSPPRTLAKPAAPVPAPVPKAPERQDLGEHMADIDKTLGDD